MMARYWINQPSGLQPDHELHGELVLGPAKLEEYVDVYMTRGDATSMRIARLSLSPGWPAHLRTAQHIK